MLVVRAFKNASLVPWRIRNRWSNCLSIVSSLSFVVSHVHREGNTCADALANIGLSLNTFVYFSVIPLEVKTDYVKTRLGWPNFRFN